MENFTRNSFTIKNWAEDDRPREKMLMKGADALSDSELLAILINNGQRERSALDIARDILLISKQNLHELGKLSLQQLQGVKGVGKAKAITIAAALELGRRRHRGSNLEKTVVKQSEDIAQYLRARITDLNYEVFAVLFLNQSNKVNSMEIMSKGGITGTVVDPRLILKKALELNSTSLVLCHNHPSGNLRPSRSDKELTLKIREAAGYHDIRVLDHLIVSEEGYFSFADEGLL